MAKQPTNQALAGLAQSTKVYVKVEGFALSPNNNDGSLIQWSLKWLGNSGRDGVTSFDISDDATPGAINTAFEDAIIQAVKDADAPWVGPDLPRNKIILIDKAT